MRVDAERRDTDLPDLEKDMYEELRLVGRRIRERKANIQEELEEELAERRPTGTKWRTSATAARPTRSSEEIWRSFGSLELDLIQNAFEVFKDLHPRQIIEDEELWSELVDRYGGLLRGRHGRRGHRPLIDESTSTPRRRSCA